MKAEESTMERIGKKMTRANIKDGENSYKNGSSIGR